MSGFDRFSSQIKTKFFLLDAGAVQNPCAGTVLDHDITRRDLYDYYLVPMNVNQGTVTPTHFIVVSKHLWWNARQFFNFSDLGRVLTVVFFSRCTRV